MFELPLLVRGDALLVLDLGLDILNGVRGFDLKSDGLTSEGFHKDLHSQFLLGSSIELFFCKINTFYLIELGVTF